MSKLYRLLCQWAIVLLLVFSITACGSSPSENITTLTLSGWQSSPVEKQLLEQLLRDFEATHPHIKVRYEVITDQYSDVIKTRLIGDAAPDIFYLDTLEAPLLMHRGVLEPLNRYITPEFDLKDFQPAMLNAFKYEGKIYGLPKDFSTLALYYNTEFFQEAGLSEPPKTWAQLQEYSEKLTVRRNRDRRIQRYGYGMVPELTRQAFVIHAFGGQFVDRKGFAAFAQPKALKGLAPVIEQYQQARTAGIPSDTGASNVSEMFGQGKAAMVLDGNWAIPYLQETFPRISFAIAPVPTINGKKGTMAFTVAYVMNKQSTHKEEAWELISYLTGKEGMKAWASGGLILPTRKSVLAEFGYLNNPLYAPFVAGADYATLWQAGENLSLINQNFNNQFLSALLGEQSLAEAMKKAQATANQEIKASLY
ncbi:ABC transporter substrate-binding protein [Oscillatoria sp. HE19RPO]|uniref:ABC transporter substrate-binding protein n=1 Tax=Oscillatoria sp. HE19RPO TaxID=2954806 RepID=UPI0020C5ACC6|nr:ABC transporter substrate-binding protein [Oscillatoria sp. HE19RPO]